MLHFEAGQLIHAIFIMHYYYSYYDTVWPPHCPLSKAFNPSRGRQQCVKSYGRFTCIPYKQGYKAAEFINLHTEVGKNMSGDFTEEAELRKHILRPWGSAIKSLEKLRLTFQGFEFFITQDF